MVIGLISRSRDPLSEKETLLTRFQMQIKVKESKVNRANIFCRKKKMKAEGSVTFQNIFSSRTGFQFVPQPSGMSVGNLAFSTCGHNVTVNRT